MPERTARRGVPRYNRGSHYEQRCCAPRARRRRRRLGSSAAGEVSRNAWIRGRHGGDIGRGSRRVAQASAHGGGGRPAVAPRLRPRRRRVDAVRCAGHHLFRSAFGVGGARAHPSANAPHRETIFARAARRDPRRDARRISEPALVMLRRSFLSRFPAAAALLGIGDQKPATDSPPAGTFEPTSHPQDEWFDSLPGKHRVVFDTWTAARFPDSMQFANNIFRGNRDGYQLPEKDVAIIIVTRHGATPFAFNDAMWAKYGKPFGERTEL